MPYVQVYVDPGEAAADLSMEELQAELRRRLQKLGRLPETDAEDLLRQAAARLDISRSPADHTLAREIWAHVNSRAVLAGIRPESTAVMRWPEPTEKEQHHA